MSGRRAAASRPPRTVLAESRWPAVGALVVALAAYAALPSSVPLALRAVVVGIGVVLLVPVLLLNPRRLDRQTRWSRLLSVAQALLLLVANMVALGILVHALITAERKDGPAVLLAALQVWATDVIAFALVYWELDRGGPVARRRQAREHLPKADFRFPQDEDADAIDEVAAGSSARSDWAAGYVDYLYFSLTNSMAFSPTDVMPLSYRAKALMGVESFTAFVILALVIARAVSLLG
ncbi:MAG TPA: hypothetical protein VGO26_00235 [Amnibacterium sp.]|nr:hypothetical protein [Amnibacterium sp.]